MTMTPDTAIKVANLSKCYQIYDQPRDRLKQFLLPRLQRLTCQQPKQYFREFWALRDVSFEVKKGETVGIIGRNGSGKSTLLQLICGTLNPSAGSMQTKGRIAALLELGSGFNPEFTGRENVYMNAAVLGLSREETARRFDDIAGFADIGQFIDQPVKTYSSGMYVRLAFAVAANVSPDILIVDEALAVGDIRFQVKCQRKFEEFRDSGITILLVSHSGADIVRLCSQAIWLDGGKMKRVGEPKKIVEEYHAWMVHDTGVQKVESAKLSIDKLQDELVPIPANAFITGEEGVSVDAVGFFTDDNKRIVVLDSAQRVKIKYKITANIRIENPYFGFQVIDSKDLRVMGCNNHVLGISISPIESGTSCYVSFSFNFPEIENGQYILAVGVNDGSIDTHVRYQNVWDAYLFEFNSQSLLQKQAVMYKLPECSIDVESGL